MRIVILAAAIGLAAAPGSAATFAFTGTTSNTNAPAAPGGRCAALTVSIANVAPFFATGISNLGAFTVTQSHCLDAGPPVAPGAPDTPYFDGQFVYDFTGGDTLLGTYTGLLSNLGPGLVSNVQNFLVTGGTGRFRDASGSFTGQGTITFTPGVPPSNTIQFHGSVNAAVPEPASWALLIAGFGLTGALARRRRAMVLLVA